MTKLPSGPEPRIYIYSASREPLALLRPQSGGLWFATLIVTGADLGRVVGPFESREDAEVTIRHRVELARPIDLHCLLCRDAAQLSRHGILEGYTCARHTDLADALWSFGEAAARLGWKVGAVLRAIANGKIEPIRVSRGRWAILESELQRFLNDRASDRATLEGTEEERGQGGVR